MSTSVIKFEGSDQWAVYQSTSECMYSPVFYDALEAHIFAAHYRLTDTLRPHEHYTDKWQMHFSITVRDFLDEVAPKPKHGQWSERALSVAWIKELDPIPYGWDEAEDGVYECSFDEFSLVIAFEEGDRPKMDFVMGELYAWIAKQTPLPGVPV